jgi:hypothetical protein
LDPDAAVENLEDGMSASDAASEADVPASPDASPADDAFSDAADANTEAADAPSEAATPTCEAGPCPTTLVSVTRTTQGIAVDAQNVYYTDSYEYSVWSCPLSGCNDRPTVMAFVSTFGSSNPQSLVARNGQVYWLDYSAGGGDVEYAPSNTYDSLGVPLASGPGPLSIAADDTEVYWTQSGPTDGGGFGGQVLRCPLVGCAAPLSIASFRTLFFSLGGLAVDDVNVYWADQQGILSCPKTGCNATPTVVVPGAAADWLVINATSVYWADNTANAIYTCPLTGCSTPTVLWAGPPAQGLHRAQGLVLDDENLYWANVDANQILRCALGGCNNTPTVLASDLPRPVRMAIDATHIYWANTPLSAYGSIMSLPK